MSAEALEGRRGPAWRELEALLDEVDARRLRRGGSNRAVGLLEPDEVLRLSHLYRGLAADLMVARRDALDPALEARLDRLTARAHHVLYAGLDERDTGLVTALFDFPGAVRRNARWVLVAVALFFGPLVGSAFAALHDEGFALAVLGTEQIEAIEQMYRSADVPRTMSQDAAMTGFYVWNNIGIAFRCFATGLLFGLGPLFYLVFNGLMIGAVAGHLARVGLGDALFPFIVSHAPWELTAIALAGGAGLQMGLALIRTDGDTRIGSLRRAGPDLTRQIVGVTSMLAIAALIEGSWSPSGAPPTLKYAVGAAGAVLVPALLILGGRRRALPSDAEGRRPRSGP